MERYSEYKDSGVQWLGEIPGHWKCVPLKRICEMKSGNNLTSLDVLDKGEFPVYGANGLRGYYTQYNKEGKYILIGRQGALAGNVHLVDGKFWATDHAVVTNITSEKVYVDYMSLALISMNLNQYAFDTAAQPGLAVSKIISFSTPLPPLSEQHSIVSYLDDKCGKIDKMLEGKQKQIELLAEMKQRIIADAVNHVLNHDVKMNETNIPWLQEIHEHWELSK
ncbi:MAG: restriction endonuclease subunit S, partial [Bacteroidaceae bacterium]|nr:restriction endonuclease subunit S [Bacteroidaceae bacterium]